MVVRPLLETDSDVPCDFRWCPDVEAGDKRKYPVSRPLQPGEPNWILRKSDHDPPAGLDHWPRRDRRAEECKRACAGKIESEGFL